MQFGLCLLFEGWCGGNQADRSCCSPIRILNPNLALHPRRRNLSNGISVLREFARNLDTIFHDRYRVDKFAISLSFLCPVVLAKTVRVT